MTNKNHQESLANILKLSQKSNYEQNIIKNCFDIVNTLIIAIDLDGKITLINKKGCELLEYEEEDEIIGKKFIEEFVEEKSKKDYQLILKNFKNEKYNIHETFRIYLKTKNGIRRIIDVKNIIIKDEDNITKGILVTGEEITEFIEIQRKLNDTINQYRILAGSIPDINMYLFDEEMKFIIVEGSEMKIHGLDKHYFEGKYIYDILDEDYQSIIVPLYRSALRGREISTEYTYKSQNYIIWLIPLRNADDAVYAAMAITQNVTKEKEYAENLKKSMVKAKEANKSKSEFLANVSHEIRTPLNAILGFTEQLLKTDLNSKQEEFAKIIDKSSEHLLSLVNEILVLSKIESGRLKLDESPFKIEHVLKEVYNNLKFKADEKKLNFKYNIDKNLKRVFLGDYTRFMQVIMNLVSNAIKFTESGYVEIKCFKKNEEDEKTWVRCDIIDSGIGIPEDKLDSVFEQFKQADSEITKKYGGTGLGLTISKRIIEMQQGKITVKSKEGVGSRFTVIIPFKHAPKNLKVEESVEDLNLKNLDNIYVLLVDDDSVNRMLGKTILDNLKCKTEIANDGRDALEKLSQNTFDIILLDIHMPDISGIDIARHIRKDNRNKDSKIIAVTAAVLKDDLEEYKTAGIDDYLIKPYKEIGLFNKMINVLAKDKTKIKVTGVEDNLNKKPASGYNLTELIRISKGKTDIVINMLEMFIDNTQNDLKKMNNLLKQEKYNDIGELAHKMLPSFRHLEIDSITSDLVEIKTKTLINEQPEDIPGLIKKITRRNRQIMRDLKAEVSKLKNSNH